MSMQRQPVLIPTKLEKGKDASYKAVERLRENLDTEGVHNIGITGPYGSGKSSAKALHTAFAPQRINANREFFRIQVEQAKAILELFHHTDVTEEVSDEIENDLTDDDKAASAKAQIHRPPLNFYEMGMQKGDVLQWKDDPTITVTIVSERRISYEGEETSISSLSAKLKGYKVKHIAPGAHWLYKEKLLSDIYDETYPFEE